MKEVCAPALLALSGAATPRMSPSPKRRVLGDFLLEHVGREGGEQGAAARQDAQD